MAGRGGTSNAAQAAKERSRARNAGIRRVAPQSTPEDASPSRAPRSRSSSSRSNPPNAGAQPTGRQTTTRQMNTRPAAAPPGSPVGPMPQPTGNPQFDAAQMNRWRAQNVWNADNGVRWSPTPERPVAIRPQTMPGSGGAGIPPTVPPRTALSAPNPPPTGPSGSRALAPRQIPLSLSPAQAPSPSWFSRMLGPAAVVAGVLQPNRGLEAGAEYERRGLTDPAIRAQNEPNYRPPNEIPQPPPEAPPVPQRSAQRGQARPQQSESMTADRLNEISMALIQGQDPQPRNAAEAIAVARMRQAMGGNQMAMGGMMFPQMQAPKPPKVAKVSAPKAKKMTPPKVKTPKKVKK